MPLFDPSNDSSSPGFLGGLMGGGIDRDAFSSFLGAMGESMMSSPRGMPFAKFGDALDRQTKLNEQRQGRLAVAALLKRAGINDPAMANLGPGALSLAVQLSLQEKQQKADEMADRITNGGRSSSSSSSPSDASLQPSGDGTYYGTVIGAESNGNPNARNPNSTATGLAQFTSGTWDALRRQNPELGLTPDGRTDPDQVRRALPVFTAGNAAELGRSGHEPTAQNLYMAHFLGGSGATRFLNGMRQNPDAPASSYAGSDAVDANRGVFLNRDGTPKTAAQMYSGLTGRFASVASPFGSGQGQPTRIAGMDGTAAGSEAEVQAAERATGMTGGPAMPPQRPTQFAQAGPSARPQGGASASDVPAQGAREAQGFTIPGQQGSGDQVTGLYANKTEAKAALGRIRLALGMSGISDPKRKTLERQEAAALDYLKPTQTARELQEFGIEPGSPEFQAAGRRRLLGETDKITADVAQRRALAPQYGLKEGSEEYNSFVLGGKYPEKTDALEKVEVKRIEDYGKKADAARDMMSEVEQIRAHRSNVPYAGGFASGYRTDLGKGFNTEKPFAFGMVPSGSQAASAEALRAKTTSFQAALSKGFAGAISNKEQDVLKLAVPGLDMSSAGAAKVLDGAEPASLRSVERSKFYESWRQANGNLHGADGAWDRFVADRPIVNFDPKRPAEFTINRNNVGGWERYVPGLSRGEDRDGGDRGPPQQRQQQAPAFSRDELAAEARRRGLVR